MVSEKEKLSMSSVLVAFKSRCTNITQIFPGRHCPETASGTIPLALPPCFLK